MGSLPSNPNVYEESLFDSRSSVFQGMHQSTKWVFLGLFTCLFTSFGPRDRLMHCAPSTNNCSHDSRSAIVHNSPPSPAAGSAAPSPHALFQKPARTPSSYPAAGVLITHNFGICFKSVPARDTSHNTQHCTQHTIVAPAKLC